MELGNRFGFVVRNCTLGYFEIGQTPNLTISMLLLFLRLETYLQMFGRKIPVSTSTISIVFGCLKKASNTLFIWGLICVSSISLFPKETFAEFWLIAFIWISAFCFPVPPILCPGHTGPQSQPE